MNINPKFNPKQPPSAVGAMKASMEWMWDNFVEPRKDELDLEDAEMLTMVGTMFLDIANDAEAYHKIQSGKFIESPYSRN